MHQSRLLTLYISKGINMCQQIKKKTLYLLHSPYHKIGFKTQGQQTQQKMNFMLHPV